MCAWHDQKGHKGSYFPSLRHSFPSYSFPFQLFSFNSFCSLDILTLIYILSARYYTCGNTLQTFTLCLFTSDFRCTDEYHVILPTLQMKFKYTESRSSDWKLPSGHVPSYMLDTVQEMPPLNVHKLCHNWNTLCAAVTTLKRQTISVCTVLYCTVLQKHFKQVLK